MLAYFNTPLEKNKFGEQIHAHFYALSRPTGIRSIIFSGTAECRLQPDGALQKISSSRSYPKIGCNEADRVRSGLPGGMKVAMIRKCISHGKVTNSISVRYYCQELNQTEHHNLL